MIPYIEIINKNTLKPFAIIEPSQCWFELSYYEVGAFEVYCVASNKNLASLQKGNYIKLPNKRWLWVITSVKYEFNGNTRMISATGYEAKYLLNKRIIMTPLELPTNLANAVYKLVNDNLGTGAVAARRIQGLTIEQSSLNITIDKTQATRGNLLEFMQTLLKNNNCGCQIIYNNGGLLFQLINGSDLTATVRFSQSLDNLLSSIYTNNDDQLGTYAYVVSKVEDIYYPMPYDLPKTTNPTTYYTGIDRNEIYIESDLSTTYIDTQGVEQPTTPTSALYQGWQIEEGKNQLANYTTKEEVSGEIDLINSNYEYDLDFTLGDIVGVQDEYFNFSINSRVIKYTISQDANGYAEAADYGE